jgi:hypothetical protein
MSSKRSSSISSIYSRAILRVVVLSMAAFCLADSFSFQISSF